MIKKWTVRYPAVNGEEERRAYVYLPTMYEADPDRRYPVLYMFDGQNVFFDSDATYGKSWGMADYLDYTDTPVIVAAIECNAGPNNERLVEYSPYRFDDPNYGHFDGKGKDTLNWFVHEFKPYIDSQYRTLPDRAHTFIGGSSMGGLMSLYALLDYNDVFGRAAALSPSLWVAPAALMNLTARTKLASGTVLYMDYGSKEMGNHEGMRNGFGSYMDELVYMNSPVDYMANFPENHPYMELFRNQKAVICCGQGAWEQPDTTWYLKRIFEAKHIPVWVDLWGQDVKHDWDWWYKQAAYYMPYVLGE